MNLSKLLWIIAGILAVALVAVTGYLFLGREEVDPKVTQVPVNVEENTIDEQKEEVFVKNESGNNATTRKINVGGLVSFDLSNVFKKVDGGEYVNYFDIFEGFAWCDGLYVETVASLGSSVCKGKEYNISVIVRRDSGAEFNRIKLLAVDGSAILKKEKVVLNNQEGYLLLGSGEASGKVSVGFVKSTGDTTVSIFWYLEDQNLFDQIRTNTLPKDSPYYTVLDSLTFTPTTQSISKTSTNQEVVGVKITTVEYKNTELGFSFQLPASWKGYTPAVYKAETDGYFTVGVTHPTEKIYPPEDFPTTSKPIPKTYSFIVVPIVTWNKWYVTGEGAHPFAAGVGASEFGRNPQYVFAMAPRYYYGAYVYGENVAENDKKEGEQIARSFKVFNPIPKTTPSSMQKPKPIVAPSVSDDTLSQFKNITAWIITEDFVTWKNYYTFSQKINDLLRTYPDGQMITISKTFNPNSIEQKNTIDAVFVSLAQNNWKRIADSYATDFVRFDQYLYEKNSKPLVLTIEKTQFEKEQMIIQIDFLK